jgi:hypothetical protein
MLPGDADEVVRAAGWRDAVRVPGDGPVTVAAVDYLGGITPEMVGWWFGRMDAETYQRFHPVDHRKFAWVEGKRPGHYVGAAHLTYHCYGGPPSPVLRTRISFVPPEEMIGPTVLAGLDGLAVCAVVHALDERDEPEPEEAGRFLHVARRTGYGTEFRSAWWLATSADTDLELITEGRLRHVHEEFAYLNGFLPDLYAQEIGLP